MVQKYSEKETPPKNKTKKQVWASGRMQRIEERSPIYVKVPLSIVCINDQSAISRRNKQHQEPPEELFERYNCFPFLFLFLFFFHLTYSRWTSSLLSCLWSLRIFPSLPGSRLTIFLSRCKFSTLTTRQPMVEFYLLTFPRFPLRKKEHKSYFSKNRTHDFRTSRCAAYLLDHSGDERLHAQGKCPESVSHYLI